MKKLLYSILCILVSTFFVFPSFADAPAKGVITPGLGIGPVALGQTEADLIAVLGKPDFTKANDDGTTLDEWGLTGVGSPDLPDAQLWVLIDAGKVAKIGTDGGGYKTNSGLGVGSLAKDFIKEFGFPAKNPASGFYVFSQGIGLAVRPNGVVHTIWIEESFDINNP